MTPATSTAATTLTFRSKVYFDDIENIRAIMESVAVFKSHEVDEALGVAYELMASKDCPYTFLFAEADQNPVGYACFAPASPGSKLYFLYWIAVLNDYRGQGIGRQLLEATEQLIRECGGTALTLETPAHKRNYGARLFYQRNGYAENTRGSHGTVGEIVTFIKTL